MVILNQMGKILVPNNHPFVRKFGNIVGLALILKLSICKNKLKRSASKKLSKVNLRLLQMHIFRTVYYITKNNRQFSNHSNLIELRELNGIVVRRIIHSNVTCTNIVSYISDQTKKQVLGKIISEDRKISVIIDERTTVSKRSTLIIYLDDKPEAITLSHSFFNW